MKVDAHSSLPQLLLYIAETSPQPDQEDPKHAPVSDIKDYDRHQRKHKIKTKAALQIPEIRISELLLIRN
jgi:hypothetical protein